MKKIGKVFFLCFFSVVVFGQDKSVQLVVLDRYQNPIKQAEQGVPFLLQIIVENMPNAQLPTIPGLEKFKSKNQGDTRSTQITSYNGRHQTIEKYTYQYFLQADSQGTFTLGPVVLKDDGGNKITSNTVSIVVGDSVIPLTDSLKKQSYFARITLDKKSVFVGQQLTVTVRFYYASGIEDLTIVEQPFTNFVVGAVSSAPVSGSTEINEQKYEYKEWTLKVYPKATGLLTIPAMKFIFRPQQDIRHGFRGLFDVFINHEEQVYAAARTVDVMALPEFKKDAQVFGVGEFEQAQLVLKNDSGFVGDGLVAALTIQGSGNFEMMQAPALQLPEGLKCYDSSSQVAAIDTQTSQKTFEYIVQASQSGTFVIPGQTLWYFNPKIKSYKSLRTKSAKVTISPKIVDEKSKKLDEPIGATPSEQTQAFIFSSDQISSVLDSDAAMVWHDEDERSYLLAWLLKFLLGAVSLLLAYSFYKAYVIDFLYQTHRGYAIYVLIRLRRLSGCKDMGGIYLLFEQVCVRYGFDFQGSALVEHIHQYLDKYKRTDVAAHDWQVFAAQLNHIVFAQSCSVEKKDATLFDDSFFWMKLLLASFKNKSVL